MFNLLIKGGGWDPTGNDFIPGERMLEHTEESLLDILQEGQRIDFDRLTRLPTVFMPETWKTFGDDQLTRIGSITRIRTAGSNVMISYTYDRLIPPIPNSTVMDELADAWELTEWESHRTHWAVKDVDLHQSLLHRELKSSVMPRVFEVSREAQLQQDLVSVMMPMNSDFKKVYRTIRKAVTDLGLKCKRADDVWQSAAIMQDVVDLIAASHVVIIDCSQQNPNVFYEMGIAHTIGRDVIPITQSDTDVPFDISHLRYVKYLDNKQGRQDLREVLLAELERRFEN